MSANHNIYFAGSIRSGRDDAELYQKIIEEISKYGTVLTEHVGDKTLSALGEDGSTDEYIFNRDIAWINQADSIVAEVTTPSLGVGYELGLAEALQKPILCLFRINEGKRLSAMVAGNKYFDIVHYRNLEDAVEALERFYRELHVAAK